MSINIQLAQRQGVYTNLDVISGKVVLFLNREESFSAINVKLEGESRTRLAHPLGTRLGDRGESEVELHKLLYDVVCVFPSNPVLGAKAYTLPPGQHEYPFTFKIPFNNACNPYNIKTLKMAGLSMDMRDNNKHVKKTLPPTLTGFPGEAEVKYFVKVTAERPSFLKENFRAMVPFKFLPIEPPRPPPNTRETYGRRKHRFSGLAPPARQTFLRKPSAPDAIEPPYVSVDVRLPDPTIVTTEKSLPLRVLVTKLNDSPGSIFLRTFHVNLWAHTEIRAHELERVELTSWVVCSYANMMERLLPTDGSGGSGGGGGDGGDTNGKGGGDANGGGSDSKNADGSGADAGDNLYPMMLPSRLWSGHVLPPSVPPSFSTCNLKRWYELEVSVGLSWGTGTAAKSLRPELTVQPIRLPVQVYSGIAPSPALISAANAAAAANNNHQSQLQPLQHIPPQPVGDVSSSSRPPQRPSAPQYQQQTPQQPPGSVDPGAAGPGSSQAAGLAAPPYDEPPPSYEDAMAAELAPVDGPRRDYQVVDSAPVEDTKRRRW